MLKAIKIRLYPTETQQITINKLLGCCKYNNNHGTHNQRVSKKLSKPLLQLTLDGEFVREWPSTAEVGRNGFSGAHISSCCIGKRKTHKGFVWKYKEVS